MPSINLTYVLDLLRGPQGETARAAFVKLFPGRVTVLMDKWYQRRGCSSCRADLMNELASDAHRVQEFLRQIGQLDQLAERTAVAREESEKTEGSLPDVMRGFQLEIPDTAEDYLHLLSRVRGHRFDGLTMHVRTAGKVVVSFW